MSHLIKTPLKVLPLIAPFLLILGTIFGIWYRLDPTFLEQAYPSCTASYFMRPALLLTAALMGIFTCVYLSVYENNEGKEGESSIPVGHYRFLVAAFGACAIISMFSVMGIITLFAYMPGPSLCSEIWAAGTGR